MLGFPSTAAFATWVFLCLVWGSTWLFIKIGLEDVPPFTFAGVRFVVAFALLSGYVAVRRVRLPRQGADWWIIAVTGALGVAGSYGFVYWGEQHISSGLTALLFAAFPLFGIALAHLFIPGERLTWGKALGALVGVLGIAVLFSDDLVLAGRLAVWGGLAVIAGALAAACGDVCVKRFAGGIDPLVLAWGHMAAGAIPLLLLGWTREGDPLGYDWTPSVLVSLFYLAVVGSAIAFVLFFWLLQRIEAGQTMLIGLVTPLVAVAVGVAVLDEPVSWRLGLGGLLILGGVAFALKRPSAG